MSQNKGFTLIELLVVIAIIGILAAAALASLGSARVKGQQSAVKSQMANMRAQAELYFNGTYGAVAALAACPTTSATTNLFTNTAANNGLFALIQGVTNSGGTLPVCQAYAASGTNATAWAVAANLPGGGAYCVDSSGASRDKTAAGAAYTAYTGTAAPITNGACN